MKIVPPRLSRKVLPLLALVACSTAPARDLEVDRAGTTAYKTLAAAAKEAQPGDTIRVKPGSGPYREILRIPASGTGDNPIVFDGGNNVITGFAPLTDWEEKDGVTSCHLPKSPRVLTYKGERLVEDYATGKFLKYADLSETRDRLILRPGVEKTDWEYSKRDFAVEVKNASYQIYRNVRASGSTNDGFNLHGVGTGLVFENIEGFQNMDEGFSTHDSIQTTIRGGKFWGNDNGIANSYKTSDVVSSVIKDVDIYDNLGRGLVLHDCQATVENVRCWNNGVTQIRFQNAKIACEKVTAFTPSFTTRPWVSYHDTHSAEANSPMTVLDIVKTALSGTAPVIEAAHHP